MCLKKLLKFSSVRSSDEDQLLNLNGNSRRKIIMNFGKNCMVYPARGRVTDCGVRGRGLKSQSRFFFQEEKPVLYHEWSGMVETHSLYS